MTEMCNGIDPSRFTFSFWTEAAHSLDFIVSLNLIQRNERWGKLLLVCYIVLSAHFKSCIWFSERLWQSNSVIPEVRCVTGIPRVGQDDVFEQEQEIGLSVSQVSQTQSNSRKLGTLCKIQTLHKFQPCFFPLFKDAAVCYTWAVWVKTQTCGWWNCD